MEQNQYARLESLLQQLLKHIETQTELLTELRDAQLAPDDEGLQPGEEENDGCMYLIARQASKQTGSQLTVFMYSGHKDVTQPTGKCYSENWGALPFVPDTNGPVWTQRSSPSKQEAIDGGYMKMLPWTVVFVKKEKPATSTSGWPGKPIERTVRVQDEHKNIIPWKPGQKLDPHQAPALPTAPSTAAQAAAATTPAPKPAAPPQPPPTNAPSAQPPATKPTLQGHTLESAREFYKAACRKVAHDFNNPDEHQILYTAIAFAYTSDLVKKGVPNITVIEKPGTMKIETLIEIGSNVNASLPKWRKWWDDAIDAGAYIIPERPNP